MGNLVLFLFGSLIFFLGIQRIVAGMNDILRELRKLNKNIKERL